MAGGGIACPPLSMQGSNLLPNASIAAAAPGASVAAEGLARDLEVERRLEAQREAAEREARERVQEQERRAHERDDGHDHGW